MRMSAQDARGPEEHDRSRIGLARQSLDPKVSIGRTVMITGELVRVMNEAYARLKLAPGRIEELPLELEQLARAIEVVNAKVDFDVDPSDFRNALLALAANDD
jgi:hypothetical protein